MKRQLRYLFTAILALVVSNSWAQVETQNVNTDLDVNWSDQEGEINVSGDNNLLLDGPSDINFTIKDDSPATYTDSNGDKQDNTSISYLATIIVYSSDGSTVKGKAYYAVVRTSAGTTIYPVTYKSQTTSRSSRYSYIDSLFTYKQAEVVSGTEAQGSIHIDNGEDGDYISLQISTGYTFQYGDTYYYNYDYSDYYIYEENTSNTYGYNRPAWDDMTLIGEGSVEVNFSKLSTTTLRYDIYDDKPLWRTSDAENVSDATNILSNRLNVKSHTDRTISVYVHRNLVSGTWSTLCLPFDVRVSDMRNANALGDDVEIAEFDNMDLDGDNVNFKTISSSTTTLEAGKPYLFKYTGENKDHFFAPHVTFNYTTTSAQTALNSLSNRKSTKSTEASDGNGSYYYVGLLQPTQNGASSEGLGSGTIVYISSSTDGEGNQHLKKLSATGSIKGFRAYLYYPAGAGANAKAANGQGVVKIDEALDNPTAITTVTVDGQPVSNQIFNLQGQFVGTDAGQLPAGIYVRSGKKFVVK